MDIPDFVLEAVNQQAVFFNKSPLTVKNNIIEYFNNNKSEMDVTERWRKAVVYSSGYYAIRLSKTEETVKLPDIVKNRNNIPILYKNEKCFINDKKITKANPEDYDLWDIMEIPILIDNYAEEIQKMDTIKLFNDSMDLVKKRFVFPGKIYYKLYVLWNFATWKLPYFNVIPFLAIIAPPGTGKTDMLEGIKRLGCKAIIASDTTAAVIPRLTDKYGLTVLVDECHTLKDDSDVYKFCKSSYKKGSYYLKSKGDNDTEFIALSNYGFKAFAGEEGFNNLALSSRCIDINPLKENPEIQKFEYISKEIESVRDRSLLFSMKDNFNYDLGNDYRNIQGRTRELFEPLILIAKQLGVPYDDIEEFALQHEAAKKDELQDTIVYEVLVCIEREMKLNPKIKLKTIISHLDWNVTSNDEKRKAGARFGYQFRKLFNIKVEGFGFEGKYINLEDTETSDKIKNLFERYNIQSTNKVEEDDFVVST